MNAETIQNAVKCVSLLLRPAGHEEIIKRSYSQQVGVYYASMDGKTNCTGETR
jgi:hypothetical protein